MNKFIIVTIGDIDGIGIELLIKLWKLKKINNFILLTNYRIFKNYLKIRKIILKIKKVSKDFTELKYNNNSFLIFDYFAKNKNENTYLSLCHSYYLYKKNNCTGIITLPLNKYKIFHNVDNKFIGQTEFFQKIDKKNISNMIFYSKKLIILSLTTHQPLNKINMILSKKKHIYEKIKAFHNTLIIDFKIQNPKIAIAGINPHAGEGGLIGKEEIKYINPLIKQLKKLNINIDGPFSADSLFIKKNIDYYDCFICAYHDQALIPFKLINKFEGVNYTGSLSFIRISPNHGTAYDQLGSKNANYYSLLDCFNLVNKISINRSKIV